MDYRMYTFFNEAEEFYNLKTNTAKLGLSSVNESIDFFM